MKRFVIGSVAAVMLTVSGMAMIHTAVAMPSDPTPPPAVSLELRDAPIRAALEQIFNSAKVDYSIDPTVVGYVNLKVTDLPFESALKLILRSSTTPLTYSKDNGVYIVKPRTANNVFVNDPPAASAPSVEPVVRSHYETIELTYADPMDFAALLHITMVPVGTRSGRGSSGSQGFIGGNPGNNNGSPNLGGGNPGGSNNAGNPGGRPGSGGPGGRGL